MSESFRFWVMSVPVPQPRQRHRAFIAAGKVRTQNYTPTKHPVNAFKAACSIAAQSAKGMRVLEGPVDLDVTFVLPRPKALVWKTREMRRLHHAKKPDAENLLKALQDALTGICWRDDSQIAQVRVAKVIAGEELPHVEVEIKELDDFEETAHA